MGTIAAPTIGTRTATKGADVQHLFERWQQHGDETAREGYEHNEELRRLGNAELISVLASKHPLRAGLTRTHARDILLVLTSPQLFVQYTRDLGWSQDEYADWVTTAILEQVFGLSQ